MSFLSFMNSLSKSPETLKKADDDKDREKNKVSGTISTSIFTYITPLMLLILTIVITVVFNGLSLLRVYYETNIPLNSLIIFLLIISIFQAFWNNFNLFKTARFLKSIEKYNEYTDISKEDVDRLHVRLEKHIPLLNTRQMHLSLENLYRYGYIHFSDNDARIIKSKLGYRIGFRKQAVGFNAGILVMLGLIGTFLGLLKTIDAVGVAMAGMSDLGENFGSEEISIFISSLSAPLQGMGLAFSSSLFGLSGSLLIGYFNYLCGGAQDGFIETVSRWVDDRIPKFDPDKPKDAPGNKAPSNDDMKSMFAGFIYMSHKTNKQINRLFYALTTAVQNTSNLSRQIDTIALNQLQLRDSMLKVSTAFSSLSEKGQSLTDHVERAAYDISDIRQQASENLDGLKDMIEKLDVNLQDINAANALMVEGSKENTLELKALKQEYEVGSAAVQSALKASLGETQDVFKEGTDAINQTVGKASTQILNSVDLLSNNVTSLQTEHGQTYKSSLAEIETLLKDIRAQNAEGGDKGKEQDYIERVEKLLLEIIEIERSILNKEADSDLSEVKSLLGSLGNQIQALASGKDVKSASKKKTFLGIPLSSKEEDNDDNNSDHNEDE